MRKVLLPALCIAFAAPALLAVSQSSVLPPALFAFAESAPLLEGCGDVPEAVALAGTLNERARRIERYMEALDDRKAEIAAAEATLTRKLAELKAVRDQVRGRSTAQQDDVQQDIATLVAVYDQMKPADAAGVLTNLPADFAAEILMRVRPETGARIMASVEPRQAALLTAEMGARSLRKP